MLDQSSNQLVQEKIFVNSPITTKGILKKPMKNFIEDEKLETSPLTPKKVTFKV